MSVSGVSSNSYLYDLYQSCSTQTDSTSSSFGLSDTSSSDGGGTNSISTDLDTLLKALESGDLSGVQSALSQLVQDVKTVSSTDSTSSSTSSTSSVGSNPLTNDLNALGSALASGDLSSAQSIFANIMDHLQGPPPPPDAGASVSATSSTSSTSDTTTATASDTNTESLAGELKELEDALQSGDLSGAQSILAQIMKNLEGVEAGSSDGSSSSVSSASSTDTTTASTSGTQDNPLARDLSSLEDALQSGDLSSAQSIFATIMQHMQGPPPSFDASAMDGTNSSTASVSGTTGTSSTVSSDLNALGEALLSGDLTSAKSSFSQLLQDLQSVSSTDSTSSGAASASDTTSSASSSFNLDLGKLLETWASLMTSGEQKSTIDTSA